MAISPDDFWPGFGVDNGLPEIVCDSSTGLARAVLDYYGIPVSAVIEGGALPDLDIKHMDALQLIKLSLLEESANSGKLYEPIVDEEGKVDFIEIGTSATITDIYYEVQSGTYKEGCTGVLVSGKKPLAYRRPIEWRSAWKDTTMEIYDTGYMFNNECLQKGFNQYCTIVYNDPQLTTEFEDGIDNLYEIDEDNPWDTVTGYAHYMNWSGRDSEGEDKNVAITQQSSSRVMIELPLVAGVGLGTLKRRPNVDSRVTDNLACYVNEEEVIYEEGIPVPIPSKFRYETVRGTTKDNFTGVDSVYVIGLAISNLYSVPPTDADAVADDPYSRDTNVWARIDDTHDKVFVLNKGEHYAVAYTEDPTEKEASIVFIDNSLKTDPKSWADCTNPTHFFIDPEGAYALLDDGTMLFEETGYILPYAKRQAILVKQIFAVVNLDAPSIEIYHPQGWNNRARFIAENFEYLIAPLITVNESQPIGFNGRLIDQVSGKLDHDPTTAQDFEDTDLERAQDEMALGGGQSLNLTFLDEEQVVNLSGALYNYLNASDGIESTYVCGPNANPKLGSLAPNGGIVNSISYSYQDGNSYTISVNAGPKTTGGFASPGTSGPTFKATEALTCQGTVIQDLGNNIHFKVRVDGIGERIAVNMIPNIIRTGDVVSVSIHNNPVEA